MLYLEDKRPFEYMGDFDKSFIFCLIFSCQDIGESSISNDRMNDTNFKKISLYLI